MSIEVAIVKATLCGKCSQCGQPATGIFDYDNDVQEEGEFQTTIKCVSCGNEMLIELDAIIEVHHDAINDSKYCPITKKETS